MHQLTTSTRSIPWVGNEEALAKVPHNGGYSEHIGLQLEHTCPSERQPHIPIDNCLQALDKKWRHYIWDNR